MNWDDPRLRVAIIAIVVITAGWFLFSWLMPGPAVRRGDGVGLNVRPDEAGETNRSSSLLILDNIQFDLDKYEPVDVIEAERIAAMKRGRATLAAAQAVEEALDDYHGDLRGELGAMFNKAMFYESKGEYDKAIRILVTMTKNDFRSETFRSKVYLKLAQLYGYMKVDKQHWKAMLRYFEIMEAQVADPDLKQEYRKKRLHADQKVALLGGGN